MDDVKIKIITQAETQGAEKAAESLKQVTQATQEAAPAHDKLGNAIEGADAKHKYFGMSLKELKTSVKDAAHQIPGLGYVFFALRNPIMLAGAAAATVATAFVGLIGKIRELREATRERIGPGISQKDADEAAQAVAGLSRAYAAHHDAVKNLAEGEITLGEKTKRIIENLREELRLRNELANSEKNVKLAEVGEKEAREEMTPAQAIEARRKIEDEYAMRTLNSGISMEEEAFKVKQNAHFKAMIKEDEIGKQFPEAESKQKSLVGNLAVAKERAKRSKEEYEKRKMAADDMERAMEAYQKNMVFVPSEGSKVEAVESDEKFAIYRKILSEQFRPMMPTYRKAADFDEKRVKKWEADVNSGENQIKSLQSKQLEIIAYRKQLEAEMGTEYPQMKMRNSALEQQAKMGMQEREIKARTEIIRGGGSAERPVGPVTRQESQEVQEHRQTLRALIDSLKSIPSGQDRMSLSKDFEELASAIEKEVLNPAWKNEISTQIAILTARIQNFRPNQPGQ